MKQLLVLIDTFTGWIYAFPPGQKTPPRFKRVKPLLKESIPRLDLPWTLQSNNGPAFVSQVTQGVTQALGIKYHPH
jgi:hypothetical protein